MLDTRILLPSFSIMLIVFIGIFSCDTSPKNISQQMEASELIQVDSVKKKQIDQRIDSINQQFLVEHSRDKFPFPLLAPEDSIEFWEVAGEVKRVSMFMTPDSQIVWPTYFHDKGELMMIRFRYGVNSQHNPWAMEQLIYLEKNQVVHCEERKTKLAPGETPGYLRILPFQLCAESADSIAGVYISMWDKLKLAIAEHQRTQ